MDETAHGIDRQRDIERASRPLVSCSRCGSPLLYPTSAHALRVGVVLGRRCPECDHRDRVTTSRLVASLWYLRCSHRYQELRALAQASKDGLPLDPDAALAELMRDPSPDRR